MREGQWREGGKAGGGRRGEADLGVEHGLRREGKEAGGVERRGNLCVEHVNPRLMLAGAEGGVWGVGGQWDTSVSSMLALVSTPTRRCCSSSASARATLLLRILSSPWRRGKDRTRVRPAPRMPCCVYWGDAGVMRCGHLKRICIGSRVRGMRGGGARASILAWFICVCSCVCHHGLLSSGTAESSPTTPGSPPSRDSNCPFEPTESRWPLSSSRHALFTCGVESRGQGRHDGTHHLRERNLDARVWTGRQGWGAGRPVGGRMALSATTGGWLQSPHRCRRSSGAAIRHARSRPAVRRTPPSAPTLFEKSLPRDKAQGLGIKG